MLPWLPEPPCPPELPWLPLLLPLWFVRLSHQDGLFFWVGWPDIVAAAADADTLVADHSDHLTLKSPAVRNGSFCCQAPAFRMMA